MDTRKKRKNRDEISRNSNVVEKIEKALYPLSPRSILPQPVYSLCLFEPTSAFENCKNNTTEHNTSAATLFTKNLLGSYPLLFNLPQKLPNEKEENDEKWADNVYEMGPTSGIDFGNKS